MSSCEKIIPIDLPDQDRKIVINGLLAPDSLVNVNLSLSLSVLEPDSFLYLSDAEVDLYRDNELLGRMVYDSVGFYSLPAENKIRPNHTPSARVTHYPDTNQPQHQKDRERNRAPVPRGSAKGSR